MKRSRIPAEISVLTSTGSDTGSGGAPRKVVIDGIIFQFEEGGSKLVRIGGELFCRAHEHALNTSRGRHRPSCHQWHPICRHSYAAIHPIRGPEVSSHIEGEPCCRFTPVSPSPSAPLMLVSASLSFQGRIGEKALQILHQDRCVDMLARVKTDTALFLLVCPFLHASY